MIYLIRHGETEANIKHIYCGSTDLPLSEAGVKKLREKACGVRMQVLGQGGYGDSMPEETLEADFICGLKRYSQTSFITSGMQRTEQTLQMLFGNVPHEEDPRFREIDFGIFEMHSYYDLVDTPEYQEWISGDNEKNICPGGESGKQMETRVMEAFGEIVSREQSLVCKASDDKTVIVTHGGVIAAIMAKLFPHEHRTRFDWQPAPGCGYMIDLEQSVFKTIE